MHCYLKRLFTYIGLWKFKCNLVPYVSKGANYFSSKWITISWLFCFSLMSELMTFDLYFQGLQNATTRSYGWSYVLGWVGMILAALSATFYSVAGCYIGGERYDDKEYLDKRREYMETQMGPDYYYGRPYPQPAMIGPYVYDMETRRQLPAIGYGDPYVSWS